MVGDFGTVLLLMAYVQFHSFLIKEQPGLTQGTCQIIYHHPYTSKEWKSKIVRKNYAHSFQPGKLSVHTTALNVSVVFSKWIITVPGLITA